MFAREVTQTFRVAKHLHAGEQVFKLLVAFGKLFELAPDRWRHGFPGGRSIKWRRRA